MTTYDSLAAYVGSQGGRLEEDVPCTVQRLETLYPTPPYSPPLFRTSYYTIVLHILGEGQYFHD